MQGRSGNWRHLYALAMTLAGSERTGGLLSALEGLYAVSVKIIDLIMQVAPYAVACLLFNNTARFGLEGKA